MPGSNYLDREPSRDHASVEVVIWKRVGIVNLLSRPLPREIFLRTADRAVPAGGGTAVAWCRLVRTKTEPRLAVYAQEETPVS
jgi:hypothetical protein